MDGRIAGRRAARAAVHDVLGVRAGSRRRYECGVAVTGAGRECQTECTSERETRELFGHRQTPLESGRDRRPAGLPKWLTTPTLRLPVNLERTIW